MKPAISENPINKPTISTLIPILLVALGGGALPALAGEPCIESSGSFSCPLSLSAEISGGSDSDAISIEAVQYAYITTMRDTSGAQQLQFDDVVMPFTVHSNAEYFLEIKDYGFRCQTKSTGEWGDEPFALDIQTRQVFAMTYLGADDSWTDKVSKYVTVSGSLNVSDTLPNSGYFPVPGDSGRDFYFKIEHPDFNTLYTDWDGHVQYRQCQGGLTVIATQPM